MYRNNARFLSLLTPNDGSAGPATDGAGSGGGGDGSAGAASQQQSGNADKGFPDNTPVKDMTPEQQAAYYLHQNRQTDNKLKGFNGFTPQDVDAMWRRLEQLEGEKLSDNDKALKEAQTRAANEAKSAAQPQIHAAQLEAAAARVIKDDEQLSAFLAIADPSKFVGEDGAIDKDKVIGHLTAIYGGSDSGQGAAGRQQQAAPSWGQQSGGNAPPAQIGAAAQAALAKRHGVKQTQ